jgi:hypothetical protein
MSRPYSRIEIDKAFIRVKFIMHQEALVWGNGIALSKDSYTGQSLWGGDAYDYDHIFPCEMIHSYYKDQLSDIQIAQLVNCKENIAVTQRKINMSKGNKNPEQWITDTKLMKNQGVDIALAKFAISRAKQGIRLLANKFLNENQEVIR